MKTETMREDGAGFGGAQMPSPESEQNFCFVPDRYYLLFGFVNIPHVLSSFGLGGDIAILIWRKPDEPRCWHGRYRFRHYRGKGVWNGQDRKSWFTLQIPDAAEDDVLKKTELFLDFAGGLLHKADVIVLKCDGNETVKRMQTSPPKWLHLQSIAGHD